MKRRATLTQRVVWALTGSVAVAVTILAVLSYLAFDQMEDDLAESVLISEAERVELRIAQDAAFMPAGGPHTLGNSMNAWLFPPGKPRAALPAPLHGLEAGVHEIESGLTVWHARVSDTPNGRLYVVYDATENEARVHGFGLFVLAVGLVCMAAAYAISRRVARAAVGPMLDLAQRLAHWAPDAPGMAVTRDDEAGRLIQAFNRVQEQVEQSIARERQFTANLSHEVRTPLAAIRSDSELMLLDANLGAGPRARLTRIVGNVDGITDALASVRAMTRGQPGRAEPARLAACMDDAWRGMEDAAAQAGMFLRNEIDPEAVRVLDRYALLMVLRNLVRNAIEHAAPATLTATLGAGGELRLRDDGRGIAAADLPFVFDRYYSGRLRDSAEQGGQDGQDDDGGQTGADGGAPRGLGLAIAKRVCDMQGWRLEVESAVEGPERGTCFILCFA
jgi:signal transduction histidine kinase